MAYDDGWTFYQMPWKQWAKGATVNYATYPVYSPGVVSPNPGGRNAVVAGQRSLW
jgi:hypothetical protein